MSADDALDVSFKLPHASLDGTKDVIKARDANNSLSEGAIVQDLNIREELAAIEELAQQLSEPSSESSYEIASQEESKHSTSSMLPRYRKVLANVALFDIAVEDVKAAEPDGPPAVPLLSRPT